MTGERENGSPVIHPPTLKNIQILNLGKEFEYFSIVVIGSLGGIEDVVPERNKEFDNFCSLFYCQFLFCKLWFAVFGMHYSYSLFFSISLQGLGGQRHVLILVVTATSAQTVSGRLWTGTGTQTHEPRADA